VCMMQRYIDGLEKDDNPGLRRGFTLALGALPKHLLVPRLEEIVSRLLSSIRVEKEKSKRDAETRRNSARSIIRVVRSVGVECGGKDVEMLVSKDQISSIFDGLIGGMNDYSIDRRGDVGSWVRMASMESLEELTTILADTEHRLSQSNVVLMMANVCRQMADKIDRVREAAGKTLERLLRSAIDLTSFPVLQNVVKKLDKKPIDWAVPTQSFHFLVYLLDVNEFRTEVLEGLIVAMGGITEHVAQAALSAWKKYSTKHSGIFESALSLANSLMDICKKRKGVNRVVIPLFRCSETLISSSLLSKVNPPEHSFANDLIDFVRKEMIVTKSVMKLLEGVNTFCVLMSFGGDVQKDAIIQLLLLLNHQYPKVRRTASEQLYTMMLTLEEGLVDDDVLDDVLVVLSETRWDGDNAEEIVAQQIQIFSLMKIEKPARNEYNVSSEDGTDGGNSQSRRGDGSSYRGSWDMYGFPFCLL
jgi:tubulin-specific chaperone D